MRFKEHCRDSRKENLDGRPLLRAMHKYGVEHFHIELIEETDQPEEREIYWIERLGSYKYGYNATLGGDGKRYIDYDLVIKTYLETQSKSKTAELLGIDRKSVVNILRTHNIAEVCNERVRAGALNKELYGKHCAMMDKKTNEVLGVFESLSDAARYIIDNQISQDKIRGISGHIGSVCAGKRQIAYGYKWKFL